MLYKTTFISCIFMFCSCIVASDAEQPIGPDNRANAAAGFALFSPHRSGFQSPEHVELPQQRKTETKNLRFQPGNDDQDSGTFTKQTDSDSDDADSAPVKIKVLLRYNKGRATINTEKLKKALTAFEKAVDEAIEPVEESKK